MAKVQDTAENFEICMRESNCEGCPSYAGDGKAGLYCVRGKSSGKVERKGCNCPECPVWINNKLTGMYFCDRGAAK